MDRLKNTLRSLPRPAKKKRGIMMPAFLLICMIGIVVLMAAVTEYNNILIVRNLEATADLAAVEALRMHVDEEAFRNERLEIKPEDFPKIRDTMLEKIRENIPKGSMKILRIEIPEIREGKVTIPEDYINSEFPYSTSNHFVDYGSQQNDTQQWWLLGGTTPGNSSMAIVRDTSNINTASSKQRTSYIVTAKIVVVYETVGLLNRSDKNILNFVDVFTDTPVTIETMQPSDRGVKAITIECEGKVTMR